MRSYRPTRRDLLQTGIGFALAGSASLLAGCSGGGGGTVSLQPPAPNPTPDALFLQPPVLRSSGGVLSTTLDVQMGTNVLNGITCTGRTYGGVIGGPTLRVRPGDHLSILIDNNLPPNPDPGMPMDINIPHHFNSTNLHTHGLHVSPNQDNVLVEVEPGAELLYEYDIPLDHPCGTFFYHPHKHGSVTMQMFGGMGGTLIVEGGVDEVPEVAAAEDLVFLINELNVDGTGVVPDYTATGVYPLGQRILTVNGAYQPTLTVWPGQVVRLRVVNSTVRTHVPLAIDGATLNVIARDGITLPALQNMPSLTLAPGNRADLLVRIDTPGTYAIHKGVRGADPDVVLANIVVNGPLVNMLMPTVLPVPASLPDILPGEVTEARNLVYNHSAVGGPPGFQNFTIDGVRFDPAVVNQAINLGAVIEWTVSNASMVDHPHHIHIHPFQLVAVNGAALPTPVWLDTVDVPTMGNVTLRQRFPDFPGDFVLHCHILVHEDVGMMQLVRVS